MDKNKAETLAITAVHLQPKVTFGYDWLRQQRSSRLRTATQITAMHEQAR